ncbi:C4b-binding protein alpha chain [Orycteropus afer afer]|uniref:C4b-binding protein alpha chain n=1 Tax=Orycteropus afer afer TaxID=1230840 RepID=A0A8B7AVN8_ORYAF|nr:C4b-binding protein alpha chain [Orycteropus afer afer]
MHPPRAPNRTLHRTGKMAVWPFSGLWNIYNTTLFQMTLIAALLAAVLGDCDPPDNLFFASPISEVNETSFKVGTKLRYTCRPGYSKSSSNLFLTCTQDGSWKYHTFCIKKRCRNPGDLLNGQVEIKTDLYFGSQIEFSCLEGYLLIGATTSYCDIADNGVGWSNPLPVCVIAHCEPPPDISNGKHNGGEDDVYTYGSSVAYRCDPQYSLLGQASISCMVENKTIGVWRPSAPTCKKITCPRPEVPNGMIQSGFGPTYIYKDSVMFNCKAGYVLRGSRLIHCEEDNNWHPSPPICELNSCTNLPNIPHANWEIYKRYKPREDQLYSVGTVLRYHCNSGYRPAADEPTTVTCQEDLTWTPFKGCEKICCQTPDLKNGEIIHQKKSDFTDPCDYFFGDSIRYTCHKRSTPKFDATCQADGLWHPKTPTCDDSCDFPPAIAHGRHTDVGSFFRTEVLYECDEGYILVGQARISCSHSVWSPPVPKCKALCQKPEIENGKLSVHRSQYIEGENITVQCNLGYGVVGSQSISCLENRTWYPKVSKCEWEVPEGCEKVLASKHLMQCLPNPQDVKLALELYKLSLEIEKLERERDMTKKPTQQSYFPQSIEEYTP